MLARSHFRLAILLLAVSTPPATAHAQSLDALAGGALGAVGGAYLSAAVVTGNARAGRFVFSPTELSWELAPIPLGAVAAGILAHRNPDRFWRTTGWGLGGFAAGSLVGAAAGRALWGPAEGTWSGAVLGGAAGLLVGALAGALTWEDDAAPLQAVTFAVPAPW